MPQAKMEAEGALFLVRRKTAPSAQLVLLNRVSSENVVIAVLKDMKVSMDAGSQILMVRLPVVRE